jgi:hypothetical protein
MNVEIGAEAALFPEKEYINGIAVAVYGDEMTVACSYRFDQINNMVVVLSVLINGVKIFIVKQKIW